MTKTKRASRCITCRAVIPDELARQSMFCREHLAAFEARLNTPTDPTGHALADRAFARHDGRLFD